MFLGTIYIQKPLSTSDLTPRSTHLSSCLLNIPLTLPPGTQTPHMQKRIQSPALPQTLSSSCVPISLTGTAIHTANSQDRSPRTVLVSAVPYSALCVPPLCPTHMHVHRLLSPLATLPLVSRSIPFSTCNQSDLSNKRTYITPPYNLTVAPHLLQCISSAQHASEDPLDLASVSSSGVIFVTSCWTPHVSQ